MINGKNRDELTNLRSETEGIWEKGAETMELSFEGTTVSFDVPVGYYVATGYEDTDGEYTTEKIIYKDEKLMLNLYLWKNSSDTQSGGVSTWISKINADYYDDGADHVQTMTVDGKEVSYISVMEVAASDDEFFEKDATGKKNGVMYAVCPINDKVFYVVQVREYDVEDMPELSDYEKLFYLALKNES